MSSAKVKEKKNKGNGGGRKERESWRVGMSDGERKCEKVSGRARERGDRGRKRERKRRRKGWRSKHFVSEHKGNEAEKKAGNRPESEGKE